MFLETVLDLVVTEVVDPGSVGVDAYAVMAVE